MSALDVSRLVLVLEVVVVLFALLFTVRDPSDAWQDCDSLTQGPALNGECFFTQTYVDARANFRRLASEAGGFELYNYTVYQKGGLELTTDIAILPGLRDRVLVHMSGTHGPEGFAGSAIQSAEFAYRNFPGKEEYSRVARPTQIYVHAVNPFGMHNNRRVNEDNIDLNRNFLTSQEFAKAKARDPNHAGYVTFDHLLNPGSKPFDNAVLNKLHATWLMAYSIARHGLLSIKRAMVSGNYHKPDGLYYGGDHMATSTSKLIEFLTSYFAAHNGPPRDSNMVLSDDADSHAVVPLKKVIFIDVHSGLGVSGLDTLDVDPRSAGLAYRVFHDIDKEERLEVGFNDPQVGVIEYTGKAGSKAMAGYDAMIGGTCGYFCGPHFKPWAGLNSTHSKMCVTQEFGTVAPHVVGSNLVEENFAWHHHLPSSVAAGLAVRDSFYVDTVAWKRSVVARGNQVIVDALRYLMV